MIEVRNLGKNFGRFRALDDVSFAVEPGETFALLGPNGSGKTTTLKCIAGLTTPTEGEIRISGKNSGDRAARVLFSYLPQRLAFPENLTAREVLAFYCRLRKLPAGRIGRVLERSNLNFNGFADRPVGEFSGGMVQRLGIAVALLPDSPILILDEPTVSLDPEGAIRFRQFLATLKQEGKTVIFSSHVLADVEMLADRVAMLVAGKLMAVESVDHLRNGLMIGARVRLLLLNPDRRFVAVALNAGASEANLANGGALIFWSRPENRLAILRALEDAGATIERFSTEEPSLEELYLRYVNEATIAGAAGGNARLPDRAASAR